MPKAGGEPNDKARNVDRDALSGLLPEVLFRKLREAAHPAGGGHGIENVVTEPGTHRDMPASPILLKGGGEIRAHKVLGDLNAKHLGYAYRNVDAAGEVRVELKGIEHHSDYYVRSLKFRAVADYLPDCDKDPVGDNELFEKAP